jgi:predicted nucleic acid-binding protein
MVAWDATTFKKATRSGAGPPALGPVAADPSDALLLAMALAGEADFLVIGDHRAGLLQRRQLGRTRIVTPAAFCAAAL